ncbi:MAG: hypothetical protein RLZZ384_1436 [Pseudomonadota bacterium]
MLKNWLLSIVDTLQSLKTENLKWNNENQAHQAALKQSRVLAERALVAELKKRSRQLKHELTILQTQHSAELLMFKTKCKQDVKDYKQYLESLDQLKDSIQSSYTHLPEAVAFTIHHHAKYLLNEMWETTEFEEKMRREIQLIRFMSTVHEDARLYLEGKNKEVLPERTLKFIEKS